MTIPFLLDTGFEGYLSIPQFISDVLGLTPHTAQSIRLADGTEKEVQRFLLRIDMDGILHEVPAIVIDEYPVVGMRLLYGRDIFIKNQDGGPVLVI